MKANPANLFFYFIFYIFPICLIFFYDSRASYYKLFIKRRWPPSLSLTFMSLYYLFLSRGPINVLLQPVGLHCTCEPFNNDRTLGAEMETKQHYKPKGQDSDTSSEPQKQQQQKPIPMSFGPHQLLYRANITP